VSEKPSVIFLHIPKTAGQSVHAFLQTMFAREEVCPARENFQLIPLPIVQLRKYRLFSGHLDWCLLDVVSAPRFVFTILRHPIERILSFYFYLRFKAATLSAEALQARENQGLNAALNLTPDEYFSGGTPGLRQFIDDHYDNFYSYYFCGRSFNARHKLRSIMTRQNSDLSEDRIVDIAIENLREIDRVYTTHDLDRLEADVRTALGAPAAPATLSGLHINKGDGDLDSRLQMLRDLGASERTYTRLEQMTAMDNRIWKIFSGK
jgi:hypothetical protein